jgi:hypothetical protein
MTSHKGLDLEQYRRQAKELLNLELLHDSASVDRFRSHHPEQKTAGARGNLKLADAQLVIARELGVSSWAKLKEDLLFQKAVCLLDSGNTDKLDSLLKSFPNVLRYRCYQGDWYEQGYFKGATLLNHIAGNPIRCPLPSNILDVARLLIGNGADPDIATSSGITTIGLIITGKQVSDAGVGVALIDILKAAGATDQIDIIATLTPIWNGGRGTAEKLIQRGARIDIRHAAALGQTETLARLLEAGVSLSLMQQALVYACHEGERESVRIMLQHGARGDVSPGSDGAMPAYAASATALHMAAWTGHLDIVSLLTNSGAHATVIEPTYNGTAVGWARYAGHHEIAELLAQDLMSHGLPLVEFLTSDPPI